MILGSNVNFHQDCALLRIHKNCMFSTYNGTYVRPKVQQQHPPRHGKLLRFVARPWDLPPFQGDPLGLDGWMIGHWLEFGVETLVVGWNFVGVGSETVLWMFCLLQKVVKIFVWEGGVGEGTFCALSCVWSETIFTYIPSVKILIRHFSIQLPFVHHLGYVSIPYNMYPPEIWHRYPKESCWKSEKCIFQTIDRRAWIFAILPSPTCLWRDMAGKRTIRTCS